MLYMIMVMIVICIGICLSASIGNFMDGASIMLVLFITLPTLFMSGLGKDFAKGFKMSRKNLEQYSLDEIEKALLAYNLFGKNIILSGIIGTLIGVISILQRIGEFIEMKALPPSMAVASLTTLYAMIIGVFIVAIQTKLKALIIEKKVAIK